MTDRTPPQARGRDTPRRAPRFGLMALSVTVLLASGAPALAADDAPVECLLAFNQRRRHLAEVAVRLPVRGRDRMTLRMAVWTPGSYLVRDYARHIEGLVARLDGRPVALTKVATNRWTVPTRGGETLQLGYAVYGRDMSVRGNWIEADFAMINGAPTIISAVGDEARPHELTVLLPKPWKRAVSALPRARGQEHRFRAESYDQLVDSPLVCGNPKVYRFRAAGKPHRLVTVGERGVWPGARAARDVKRIVEAHARFWGSLPYERYTFFNMITEAGGGLEHSASTLMMTHRHGADSRKGYLGWLGLVSHEFFHTWNVKRLRPVTLGPFNYDGPNYTRSLWVVEGLTTYYSDILLARAGLASESEVLDRMSRLVKRVQQTPGRRVQSLSDASFDAWIKFYKPDENSRNTAISYYSKGAVVGLLLDARIRLATGGARSLDDVMRAAMKRWSGGRGYRPEEFEALCSKIAGVELGAFFDRAVRSTKELDYTPALKAFGLSFAPPSKSQASLGLRTRSDGGRLRVAGVQRGDAGDRAGINVDDELIAMDGFRLSEAFLAERLKRKSPGDRVTLLIARRGVLRTLTVKLGRTDPRSWRFVAEPEGQATRERWLGGRTPKLY